MHGTQKAHSHGVQLKSSSIQHIVSYICAIEVCKAVHNYSLHSYISGYEATTPLSPVCGNGALVLLQVSFRVEHSRILGQARGRSRP